MKFPRLEIENFLAITKAEISLADRGLIAIQGINSADTSANSNGAGKSSIADALCWAIFGTTARGASGDTVVNETAGKNCRVSVTLQDGAMTYTITRHRKHKTGKNNLHLKAHDGLKETDLTKGTDKLTQDEVNKIVGSSLEVFAGSIYAGQERMPDLPAMTDKALKMLIEEAAGITLLEEAYQKAREGAQTASTMVGNAEVSLRNLEKARDDLLIQKSAVAVNLKEWDEVEQKSYNEAMQQAKGCLTKLKTLKLEIAAFDPAAIVNAIADADKKIAGVQTEHDTLLGFEREISAQEAKVRSLNMDILSKSTAINTANHQLAHVDAKVGTPCGECGRDITPTELAASRQGIEEKIAQFEKDLAESKKELAAADQQRMYLTSKRDQFKAGMTDVSAEQMTRDMMVQRQKDYTAKVNEHDLVTAQARGHKQMMEAIKARINPYAGQEAMLDQALEKTEKDILNAQKTLTAAQTALDVEKEVVRVFSPAGVRARILDEVTPFLNAQTSKYLSTLSDGNISATWSTLAPAAKKGEFKEKFCIDVVNNTGGSSFTTQSGGEKRKARIATALALQDLVATRASKPIDLFIGDEIDDALDVSGLERLMLILEDKAKERGSVFVISHNDLADWIRQTMTIEKMAGGETKITEVVS